MGSIRRHKGEVYYVEVKVRAKNQERQFIHKKVEGFNEAKRVMIEEEIKLVKKDLSFKKKSISKKNTLTKKKIFCMYYCKTKCCEKCKLDDFINYLGFNLDSN